MAAAVAAAVVLVAVIAPGDDGPASAGNPWDAVPVSDAPTAASPEQQEAFEQQVAAGITQEDFLTALPFEERTPRMQPTASAGAEDAPPGGATEAHVPPPPTAAAPSAAGGKCLHDPKPAPSRAGLPYVRTCLTSGYGALPLQAVGVMYQVLTVGGEKQIYLHCTASVANTETAPGSPGNGSVLVTAGHCLGDVVDNAWDPLGDWLWLPAVAHRTLWRVKMDAKEIADFLDRWAWYPRVDSAGDPIAFVPRAFKQSDQDFAYDFAAVVMSPHESTTIMEDRGGLAVDMTGKAAGLDMRSYGNPASYQFKGNQLFTCSATSKAGDPIWDTTFVVHIGCDMTGGASGGPWLAVPPDATGEAVVSLNSYGVWRCASNRAELKSYRRRGYDDVKLCGPACPAPICAPRSNANILFGPVLDGKHWPSLQEAAAYATT